MTYGSLVTLVIRCNSEANGAEVWIDRTEFDTKAKELHKFQRLAFVSISGAMKT